MAAWAALGVVALGLAVLASVTYAPRLVELRTPVLALALLGFMITCNRMMARGARRG